MFTGIIQHRGEVVEAREVPFGRRLLVKTLGWSHSPAHGESIAVNGCCLTVTAEDGTLAFDVIAQTLKLTTLGDLAAGDAVNLEPCVTPTSLMSGHIVQGHVDGVGRITRVKRGEDEVRLSVEIPDPLRDYVVPKGSVTIDGVSLTIAEITDDGLEVALIPTTLDLTTLGLVDTGTRVNLEMDMIVKTLAHLARRGRLDLPPART